jgi:S-adenosylhomocysteine hydrolase
MIILIFYINYSADYRVADISLADFGRKEIELAEHEVYL